VTTPFQRSGAGDDETASAAVSNLGFSNDANAIAPIPLVDRVKKERRETSRRNASSWELKEFMLHSPLKLRFIRIGYARPDTTSDEFPMRAVALDRGRHHVRHQSKVIRRDSTTPAVERRIDIATDIRQ
jgi:hypothetical protein